MPRYVLTGAPGSGKSSILLGLERWGERIIRECAQDHIELRRSQGAPEPWTEPDFQQQILELQLQRERLVPREERVFIDRGIHDGLAYTRPGDGTHERVAKEASKTRYDHVFLIERLGTTPRTAVRREDQDGAEALGRRLELIYAQAGYRLTRVPAAPLDERVDAIRRAVGRLESP